jgi:hypothetical protein
MTRSKLTQWDAAVKKRRDAIIRLLSKIRLAKGKIRAKRRANLNNAMHYGVMNKHQSHWHKINGIWFLNSVRTRRLRVK